MRNGFAVVLTALLAVSGWQPAAAQNAPVPHENPGQSLEQLPKALTPDRGGAVLQHDPMKGLGFGSNAAPDAEGGGGTADKPLQPDQILPGFTRMDRNGDGLLSRNEYMAGRAPANVPGNSGGGRMQRYDQRLKGMFRSNDLNNDGYVSPQELNRPHDPRF